MLKINKEVISAFASLEGVHDWEVIMDWLKIERDELRAYSESTKDEVLLRWSQGANQVLTEIIGQKLAVIRHK